MRLSELLPKCGYPTRAEAPYPAMPRCRCDCLITLPCRQTLWLENKGAWKHYWRQHGGLLTYRSYLLHPLVPELDATKTHTVPFDLEKLRHLAKPHADYCGMLLIGFDTADDPMDEDVLLLVRLAQLGHRPWTSASDSWSDVRRPGHRIHCWLWWRPAE